MLMTKLFAVRISSERRFSGKALRDRLTSRLPVLLYQVHLLINARWRRLRTYQVHELLLAVHIELRVNVLGQP